jgi:hypothetical protein
VDQAEGVGFRETLKLFPAPRESNLVTIISRQSATGCQREPACIWRSTIVQSVWWFTKKIECVVWLKIMTTMVWPGRYNETDVWTVTPGPGVPRGGAVATDVVPGAPGVRRTTPVGVATTPVVAGGAPVVVATPLYPQPASKRPRASHRNIVLFAHITKFLPFSR